MGRKTINLIGLKFGRLTVIKKSDKKGNGAYWSCQCDCGKICEIISGQLRSGNTKSCGCLNLEQISKRFSKHGDCLAAGKVTKLYYVWQGIKARCLNPKNKSFHRYGGRGITICREWENDYKSFKKWALDNGYAEGLQIDRIENDLGYSSNNCRWVTRIENCENSGVSKLTKQDVIEIRRSFAQDPSIDRHSMAVIYGIVYSSISNIINNKTWKNI